MIDEMGRRDFVKAASVPVLLGGASVSVPKVRGANDGWTSFGSDPQNTGRVEEVGPTGNTSLDWRFETDAGVTSPAVVGEGNVYVGSLDGSVYAIHADSGTERWKLDGLGSVRSSPAYYDGTVYVNVGGTTYALEASEGGQEWTHTEGIGPTSSPNIDEVTEAVYLCKSRSVYAIDINDGSEIWTFDIGKDSTSTPALDTENDRVFVGSGEGRVHGLDMISGNEEWSARTGDAVTGGVTYDDGTVYAADGGGTVYGFDAESGSQVWSNEIGNGGFEGISPTVAHGLVYVGARFSNLYAIDAEDGSLVWEVNTSSQVNGSAAVGGDAVYFTEGRRLRAVGADDGERLWEYEIDQNMHSPVVDGDTVYAGAEADDNALHSVSGDAVPVGASIEITNAVLNNDTIDRNDDYTVTVTLENTGSERGDIKLELTRGGSLDAPPETVSVGAGDTREVTLTSETTGSLEEGEYFIEVNGVSVGTLTVGTQDTSESEDDDGEGNKTETEDEDSEDESQDGTGDTGTQETDGNESDTSTENDTSTDTESGGGDDGDSSDTGSGGDDGDGGGFNLPAAGIVAGAAGVVGVAGGVAAAYLYSERESKKDEEE